MKSTATSLFCGVVAMAGLLVARPAAADRVSVGLGFSNGYGDYFSLGINSGGRSGCGPAHHGGYYGAPYARGPFGPAPCMARTVVVAPYCPRPAPVIVAPCPAPVVVAPVVVTPAPVVVQSGYWADRDENVWVEGEWVEMTDAWGRRIRTQQPGHWEVRRTRVWVQM